MSQFPRMEVAVTGYGWELPALGNPASIVDAVAHPEFRDDPFVPENKLGKKGLRYKERSTLMTLCAAKTALQHAGWLGEDVARLDDANFGVVVACNTGNLDTVCSVAETIQRTHVDATSPMDLPNASSNIVAAMVAIRFGLLAINLLVCSGSSAALDALIIAANAIRNGRARKMIVIATEANGFALKALLAHTPATHHVARQDAPILEGSFAVVLETAGDVNQRGRRLYGVLEQYAYAHTADSEMLAKLLAAHPHKLAYLPPPEAISIFPQRTFDAAGRARIDLGAMGARSYGSTALLQLIHYCELAHSHCGTAPPAAREGATLVSGAMWADRRIGALVVRHAANSAVGQP